MKQVLGTSLILPVFCIVITSLFLFVYFYYQGYGVKNIPNNYLGVTQNPDTPFYDSFGRQRVSQPYVDFESKQTLDNDSLNWDQTLFSGDTTAGSSIFAEWNGDRASTTIKTTAGISGKYIRQTYRQFGYHPGKSQNIMLTGNILRNNPDSTIGVSISYGSFNDNNGLFFEYNNDIMYCVVRNFVTGTAIDKKVAQSEWNVDKMDGKGPSGKIALWNKVQIYVIDYAWLGAGRVRYGIIIGGNIYYVHENLTANIDNSVYLSNPDLPIRFQVVTTTDSISDIWVEQICASISSEAGAHENIGIIRSHFTDVTNTVPNSTNTYLLTSIRQKENFTSSTIIPLSIDVFNIDSTADQPAEWYLIFNPTYSATPSWSDINDSSIQYADGVSNGSIIVTGGYILGGGFNISGRHGAGERSDRGSLQTNSLLLGTSIGGGRQTLAVATKLIGSITDVDMRAKITWKEV